MYLHEIVVCFTIRMVSKWLIVVLCLLAPLGLVSLEHAKLDEGAGYNVTQYASSAINVLQCFQLRE